MLARVGDKWSMMTIVSLEEGSLRFNELRRRTGASQKMQTATLRGLERDGYVARTVTRTTPPRVDYVLTDMGQEVLGPVRSLAAWALSRIEQVEGARKRYDDRTPARSEPATAESAAA